MLYLEYFYPCALTNIRVLQMRIDQMKSMFAKVNNFSRSFYVTFLKNLVSRFHEEEKNTWYIRSCVDGGSCLGSVSGSIRFSSSAKDVCKEDEHFYLASRFILATNNAKYPVCIGHDEDSCIEKFPKQVRMVNTIVLTQKLTNWVRICGFFFQIPGILPCRSLQDDCCRA